MVRIGNLMAHARWSLALVAAFTATACTTLGRPLDPPAGSAQTATCQGYPCREIDAALVRIAALPAGSCAWNGTNQQCSGPVPRPNESDPSIVAPNEAVKGLMLMFQRYPALYCRITCRTDDLNSACVRQCVDLRTTP